MPEVLAQLEVKEGSGDLVTDVETGNLGVTEQARKAAKAPQGASDVEVAEGYLNFLEGKWKGVEGYSSASPEVRKALLDTSYNVGEGVTRFSGITKALKKGDEEEVILNLLDTASVEGKSVKGLAKRRAEAYNQVSDSPITKVEQMDDGTIVYFKGEEEFFKYKPKGGRHEKSDVGVIDIGVDVL